jgi:hypothetical protein
MKQAAKGAAREQVNASRTGDPQSKCGVDRKSLAIRPCALRRKPSFPSGTLGHARSPLASGSLPLGAERDGRRGFVGMRCNMIPKASVGNPIANPVHVQTANTLANTHAIETRNGVNVAIQIARLLMTVIVCAVARGRKPKSDPSNRGRT